MTSEAARELLGDGIRVAVSAPPEDLAEVDAILTIEDGDGAWGFSVEEKVRALRAGQIDRLVDREQADLRLPPLLVTDHVGSALARELDRAGWSWLDLTGGCSIRADGLLLRAHAKAGRAPLKADRLPRGGGALALIRNLIVIPTDITEGLGATELADIANVTQPRASQVMRSLVDLELAEKVGHGRWKVRRRELLDRFLAEYRGPGGRWWRYHSLEPPDMAARHLLEAIPRSAHPVISADLAADRLAPHRHPTDLVVYVDQPLLDPMVTPSLVPAAGEGSTNVWLCEAKDRSIWRFQEALDVPGFDRFDADLADPTQVAWDLQRLGGEDRGEALEQVVEWILRR